MDTQTIPPIEESYDRSVDTQSVTERYYTPMYSRRGQGDDFCVLFHSNRICVITLAPSHDILVSGKQIKEFNFQVTPSVNRLDNSVSGKGKRGAQQVVPSSVLFYVVCTDGSKYPVYSCVQGKLVEINEQLIEQPSLLVERPLDKGYLAIVLPPLNIDRSKFELLTAQEYNELVGKKKNGVVVGSD